MSDQDKNDGKRWRTWGKQLQDENARLKARLALMEGAARKLHDAVHGEPPCFSEMGVSGICELGLALTPAPAPMPPIFTGCPCPLSGNAHLPQYHPEWAAKPEAARGCSVHSVHVPGCKLCQMNRPEATAGKVCEECGGKRTIPGAWTSMAREWLLCPVCHPAEPKEGR